MQQATNAILRGGTIQAPTVSAKTIAEQLAEKINAKLNYVPIEKQEEEKQDGGQNESFKRYEEELEINDFPQASKYFAIIKCKWPLFNKGYLHSLDYDYNNKIFCLYFLSYLIEITTLSVIISQFIDNTMLWSYSREYQKNKHSLSYTNCSTLCHWLLFYLNLWHCLAFYFKGHTTVTDSALCFFITWVFLPSQYCCSSLPHLLFWGFIFHSIKHKFLVFIFEVLTMFALFYQVVVLLVCYHSPLRNPLNSYPKRFLIHRTCSRFYNFAKDHSNPLRIRLLGTKHCLLIMARQVTVLLSACVYLQTNKL